MHKLFLSCCLSLGPPPPPLQALYYIETTPSYYFIAFNVKLYNGVHSITSSDWLTSLAPWSGRWANSTVFSDCAKFSEFRAVIRWRILDRKVNDNQTVVPLTQFHLSGIRFDKEDADSNLQHRYCIFIVMKMDGDVPIGHESGWWGGLIEPSLCYRSCSTTRLSMAA